MVCDLLGFGEDTYHAVRQLAAKWCAEPSVHGGKKRAAEHRGDHLERVGSLLQQGGDEGTVRRAIISSRNKRCTNDKEEMR